MRALIDGDVVLHKACKSAEKEAAALPFPIDTAQWASLTARNVVKEWSRRAQAKDLLICFSDRHNGVRRLFRKLLYPSYKAGRAEAQTDTMISVRKFLEREFPAISIPWLEADDVMGLLATDPGQPQSVIVSHDKDMASLSALILNPFKGDPPVRVTPEEADRFWMTQALMGDSTDGYSGCPGIGKAKAAFALQAARTVQEMWSVVLSCYETKAEKIEGGWSESALLNARLARILRHGDYDFESGRIRLWHPEEPEFLGLPKSLPVLSLSESALSGPE